MKNKTVEQFLPGRPSQPSNGGALKEFLEIAGTRRELTFYKSRLDGLVKCVEITGKKLFEHFEDRDDRRIYQSVTLDSELPRDRKLLTYAVESMGEIPIRKMTEKFCSESRQAS